jgi:lysozyme
MSDFLTRLKAFEGYTPTAAWDYKQHTNGYGTRARFPGEKIDEVEADKRLQSEVDKARSFVRSLGVPMTEGQEEALTDLTFNAGTKWAESGLGQAVKAGDWGAAKGIFTQYNKAGGETLPGLVKRRAEGAAWMDGGGDTPAPVQSASAEDSPMTYGPMPAAPQGAFGNMQAKFASSPLGTLTSGLKRGDSTDIQAGIQGSIGGAMGAFGQAMGGGNDEQGKASAALAQSANEANAAALSGQDQAQAQIIQAMLARHQQPRGAFA